MWLEYTAFLYNEYILDTTSEAFTDLTRPDGAGYFYVNYLFGSFGPQEEPEYGEYAFTMSFYCVEDVMKELAAAPYASGSGFAGSASYAITAGTADNAAEATHAENADLAERASVCASVGAVSVIQRVGGATGVNGYDPTLSSIGIVDLTINSEAQLRTDYGFTVYIGREEELRGKYPDHDSVTEYNIGVVKD